MKTVQDLEEEPRRAVLVAVQTQDVSDEEMAGSLAELGRLARTLGISVVDTVTQKRASFDGGAYVGAGKREELKVIIDADRADTLIIDHEISPSQARNLENETGATVIDRTAVILEIFHKHAKSRAARAQVEIVRLKYLAPRMREQNVGQGERKGGGKGARAAGESKLETDRRKIRDRIAELEEELVALEAERKTQRGRRQDLARVALVGYTNAGKSTLMRGLTSSEVYVADKLFATLDTTVRHLMPETKPKILVSDTVGFIKKLPHGLVASFKSTLDEALEASLLAHVVDASDPEWERQLEVTTSVLAEVGAGEVPKLIVFNKLDKVGDASDQASLVAVLKERYPDCVVMSAKSVDDVATLRQVFIDFFSKDMVETELRLPYDRQDMRSELFASCQVLNESADENGSIFHVRAPRWLLDKWGQSVKG